MTPATRPVRPKSSQEKEVGRQTRGLNPVYSLLYSVFLDNMKQMTKPLVLVMLAAACGFGQTKPAAKKAPAGPAGAPQRPAVARWPIQRLTVEGNRIYKTEQILA